MQLIKVFTIFSFLFFIFYSFSFAAGGGNTFTFGNPTTQNTFADFICVLTVFLQKDLIPPIAVLMMLVVGFLYLTGGSNPQRISTANKVLAFTILGVAIFLLAPSIFVFIYDLLGASAPALSSCVAGPAGVNIIEKALLNIVNWFAWVFAVAAVLSGLYSAFLFFTGSSDPQKRQTAFKTFVFSIVGVVIAIFAFSIIYITKKILGL